MSYPHRQRAPGFPLCLCGAMPGTGPTSTWGADCTVAMRAEIDRLRQRVAELEAGSDIPRHLRLALGNARRAFAAHDRRAFGTINEDVQPVADAALAWISKLEADLVFERKRIAATVTAVEIAEKRGLRDDESPDEWAARIVWERDTARRTLSTLDCRYTGGGVADVSGSHCPLGKPCERCAGEREREEAREEGRREGMEAVAAVLDDGFDPWPAVRRTVNVGAMDERARSGIDAILDAVLADACREIRALAGAARESAARVDDVEGDL